MPSAGPQSSDLGGRRRARRRSHRATPIVPLTRDRETGGPSTERSPGRDHERLAHHARARIGCLQRSRPSLSSQPRVRRLVGLCSPTIVEGAAKPAVYLESSTRRPPGQWHFVAECGPSRMAPPKRG
jgi:hypothetical protein